MRRILPYLRIFFISSVYIYFTAFNAQSEPIEDGQALMKGEILKTKEATRRQVGGGKAIIEIFKEGKQAFIGRLTLAAGASVPLHRDPTEEYLLIESGSGEITIDGVRSTVRSGDLIYMPAKAEVSYQNGNQTLIALQIFAGPTSARKYDRWEKVETKP